MRRIAAVMAVAMSLVLGGCILRGKPTPVSATVPPPKPAPAPAPAPASLSTPQTNVELPPPQPVNPDSLPVTPQPREEPQDTTTAPKTSKRSPTTTPPVVTGPKPEAQQPSQPQPAQPQPQQQPVTQPDERAPIHEVVPAEVQQQLRSQAEEKRQKVYQLLAQARTRRLTRQEQSMVKQIESFLDVSNEAANRGDLRSADELAARALALAQGLQGGR